MQPDVAVLKFLDAVDADLSAGGLRDVEHYVRRFPEHAERIRAEYERLLPDASDDPPPDAAPTLPLPDGRRPSSLVLGERYRVIESLGRGGFSEVFLAEDTQLERRVAVKVLTEVRALSAEWRARLRREAEATNRIHDPGVCPIFDVRHEAEPPFLVMPWIPGKSLDRLLAGSAARGEGPVQLTGATIRRQRRDAFLHFVERVARTLDAAHRAGVVHRDVKPANIVVRPDGFPVLIDFGLAWLESGDAAVSRTGGLGSPGYAAPEVLRGGHVEPDPRLDVWGLGVVLFEGLMLRRPFVAGPGISLERTVVEGPPPRLDPAFGRDLQAVVETALARRREHRYPTAAALADDLQRIRLGQPVAVRAAGPLRRALAWTRARPGKVGAAVGAAAVLLSATTLLVAGWVHRVEQSVVAKSAEALAAGMDQLVRDADQWERFGFAIDERAALAEQHLRTVRELRAGVGASPTIDRALVHMLLAVGGLQLRLGETERGRTLVVEARQLLSPGRAADDATDEDRAALARAFVLEGDAYSHTGDVAGALTCFREALAIDALRHALRPDDATCTSDLAFGHLRIGTMLQRQGDLQGARREQQRAVELVEAAERLEPERVERLRHSADVRLELLTTLVRLDAPPAEILSCLESAETRLARVCAEQPRHAWAFRSRLAAITLRLERTEDPALRASIANDAVATAEHLCTLEPRDPDAQSCLVSALDRQARECEQRGDLEAADAAAARALEVGRRSAGATPHLWWPQHVLVSSLRTAARIARQRGRSQDAHEFAREAVHVAEALWLERPSDVMRAALLVDTLLRDEIDDPRAAARARAVLDRFRASGGTPDAVLIELERRARDVSPR